MATHSLEWGRTPFSTTQELVDFLYASRNLAGATAAGTHTQRNEDGEVLLQHPGYEAILCSGCKAVTLRTKGSPEQRCGSAKCLHG